MVNTDNDSPGVSTFPSSGITTTEAGGTATFTIWLNTLPVGDVPINFTSNDTGEGTVIAKHFHIQCNKLEYASNHYAHRCLTICLMMVIKFTQYTHGR
jgi:hypothetical protein